MSNYAISLKRTSLLLAALTFTALLLVVNFASFFGKADAAQLSSRSLRLSSTLPGTETTGAAGSPTNGSQAEHTFTFTTGSAGSSATAVRLLYCTTAIGTCNTPTGLTTTSATLQSSTISGLVVDDVTVNGTIDLDTGTIANSTSYTIVMAGVDNPDYDTTDPEENTFFVRILTATSDTFASEVDEGTVASAITEGIEITARVAETLGFSTTGDFSGVDDPTTSCDPVTGSGAIQLGDPTEGTLAINNAYDNYSAFRVYTNAASGVNIYYEGSTLTKGSDDIDPVATSVLSDLGVEQFGLAIDTTSGGDGGASTPVSIESSASTLEFQYVDTTANFGGTGNITIDTDYDGGAGDIQEGPSTAQFTFEDTTSNPALIASSTGYVQCNTAAVRYVANISPTTPAGTYTTTLVYSAVPTY